MSSVSGSDRSRYEERVKEIRDEYEAKEANSSKKKNKEIEKLQKKYTEDVRNLSENHEESLDAIRDRNREVIGERDLQNQKKIEDLRKLYVDSLRRKGEESDQIRSAQKEAYQSEIENHKEISQSQRDNQIKKFNDNMEQKSQDYKDSIELNRNDSQASIHRNSSRINASHDKEKNDIVTSFESKEKAQNRLNDEVKDTYRKELSRTKMARERDNDKWANRYQETVKQMENDRTQEIKAESFQQERDKMRDRYQEALDDHNQAIRGNYEDFEGRVNERVNRQINSKGIENQKLKQDLSNEVANNTRLRRLEKNHLQEAYELKLRDLENQKNEVEDIFKTSASKKVGRVIDDSQKLFREAKRDQMEKMNEIVNRNREDRLMSEASHKDLQEHLKNVTDKRISKIQEDSANSQLVTERYYGDSVEVLKDNYVDKLDKQREKSTQDFVKLNTGMTEKIRNIEARMGNKLEQTVSAYEKRIRQKDDERKKDIASVKKQYELRIEDLERGSEDQKAMIEAKYESKIAEINNSHQEQLKSVNERHEEDLQNIAVRYNNYNRKA